MARDFSNVSGAIWMDADFRKLKTSARLVELYLRTNDRGNACGFFALAPEVGAVEVGMPVDEYLACLGDLEAAGRVMVDRDTGAVMIRRWWDNPGNWPHTIKHTAGILAHDRRGRLPQAGARVWLAWWGELKVHLPGWLAHAKRAGKPTHKRRPGDPDPDAIMADAEALQAKAESLVDTPINTPIDTPIDTPIKVDTPINTPFITGTGTGTSEGPLIARSPSMVCGAGLPDGAGPLPSPAEPEAFKQPEIEGPTEYDRTTWRAFVALVREDPTANVAGPALDDHETTWSVDGPVVSIACGSRMHAKTLSQMRPRLENLLRHASDRRWRKIAVEGPGKP